MYILLKIGIFQCHVGFQGCTLEDQIQMGTETFWNVGLGTRIMAAIDEICRFKWRYVPKPDGMVVLEPKVPPILVEIDEFHGNQLVGTCLSSLK